MFNFLFNSKIKNMQSTIKLIKYYDNQFEEYSNKQLHEKTQVFVDLIKNGQTLNQILPEAYACIKEAIKRAINLTLFDVQLMGAIALHEGKIAEMQTGEGKTLVAIVSAYLNSISKKGVHIITVNEYLAERDFILASQILQYLNTKVGLVKQSMDTKTRQI